MALQRGARWLRKSGAAHSVLPWHSCYILATSWCTYAVFLAQTLGINELWACVFFHCQGCPIQSLFFSKFWLHLVFVVACGLSCPAACGILILRPGTEPVSPVLNSSSSSFFFFLIFIWLCQVLGHAGSFSCWTQTLSCDMWDLVPWPGIEPGVTKRGILASGQPGNAHAKYGYAQLCCLLPDCSSEGLYQFTFS